VFRSERVRLAKFPFSLLTYYYIYYILREEEGEGGRRRGKGGILFPYLKK